MRRGTSFKIILATAASFAFMQAASAKAPAATGISPAQLQTIRTNCNAPDVRNPDVCVAQNMKYVAQAQPKKVIAAKTKKTPAVKKIVHLTPRKLVVPVVTAPRVVTTAQPPVKPFEPVFKAPIKAQPVDTSWADNIYTPVLQSPRTMREDTAPALKKWVPSFELPSFELPSLGLGAKIDSAVDKARALWTSLTSSEPQISAPEPQTSSRSWRQKRAQYKPNPAPQPKKNVDAPIRPKFTDRLASAKSACPSQITEADVDTITPNFEQSPNQIRLIRASLKLLHRLASNDDCDTQISDTVRDALLYVCAKPNGHMREEFQICGGEGNISMQTRLEIAIRELQTSVKKELQARPTAAMF